MSNPYVICREKLGAAPRVFSRAQKKILVAKTPTWSKTDALGCVVRDRELLLREGRIAPGVLVQANRTLWQIGENTAPPWDYGHKTRAWKPICAVCARCRSNSNRSKVYRPKP